MTGMGEAKTTYQVDLSTPQGEFSFPCPSDEFVLQAALNHGVELPFMCLQGWCITCAAKLVEGRVDQTVSRRYYPADRDAGFILPCTARPLSALTVVSHQTPAMRENRIALGLPVPHGS
jgi:ferredoxin